MDPKRPQMEDEGRGWAEEPEPESQREGGTSHPPHISQQEQPSQNHHQHHNPERLHPEPPHSPETGGAGGSNSSNGNNTTRTSPSRHTDQAQLDGEHEGKQPISVISLPAMLVDDTVYKAKRRKFLQEQRRQEQQRWQQQQQQQHQHSFMNPFQSPGLLPPPGWEPPPSFMPPAMPQPHLFPFPRPLLPPPRGGGGGALSPPVPLQPPPEYLGRSPPQNPLMFYPNGPHQHLIPPPPPLLPHLMLPGPALHPHIEATGGGMAPLPLDPHEYYSDSRNKPPGMSRKQWRALGAQATGQLQQQQAQQPPQEQEQPSSDVNHIGSDVPKHQGQQQQQQPQQQPRQQQPPRQVRRRGGRKVRRELVQAQSHNAKVPVQEKQSVATSGGGGRALQGDPEVMVIDRVEKENKIGLLQSLGQQQTGEGGGGFALPSSQVIEDLSVSPPALSPRSPEKMSSQMSNPKDGWVLVDGGSGQSAPRSDRHGLDEGQETDRSVEEVQFIEVRRGPSADTTAPPAEASVSAQSIPVPIPPATSTAEPATTSTTTAMTRSRWGPILPPNVAVTAVPVSATSKVATAATTTATTAPQSDASRKISAPAQSVQSSPSKSSPSDKDGGGGGGATAAAGVANGVTAPARPSFVFGGTSATSAQPSSSTAFSFPTSSSMPFTYSTVPTSVAPPYHPQRKTGRRPKSGQSSSNGRNTSGSNPANRPEKRGPSSLGNGREDFDQGEKTRKRRRLDEEQKEGGLRTPSGPMVPSISIPADCEYVENRRRPSKVNKMRAVGCFWDFENMLPPCGKFATPYLLKKIDLLLKSLSVKPNVVVKKAVGNVLNILPAVAEHLFRFNWSLQYSSPRKESADKAIIQEIMGWLLDRAINGHMGPNAQEETCVVLITADTDFSSLLHYLSSRGVYTVLITRRSVELRLLLGPDVIEIWDKLVDGAPPEPHFCTRGSGDADQSMDYEEEEEDGGGGKEESTSMTMAASSSSGGEKARGQDDSGVDLDR